MSALVSTPETLEEMAERVSMGDFPAARRAARKLIKHAQISHLAVIRLAAKALEDNPPRVAVEILRQMWKDHADDQAARALIEACVPPVGENRQLPQPATPASDYQPPQPVTHKRDTDVIQRRNSRQTTADNATFAKYVEERAGTAEGGQILDRDDREHADKVYASGDIDYDRAAVRGTSVKVPCLPPCGISREPQDLDRARLAAGHGDDGLCRTCRADGAPSVPTLPEGHSIRDAMDARCAFIERECDEPYIALLALRSQWHVIKDTTLRGYIGDWVAANLPDEDTARALMELGAGCANENCPSGPSPRMIRGVTAPLTLCGECRARVDEIEAEEAATDEAARQNAQERTGYQQHKAPSKRAEKRAARNRSAVLAGRTASKKAARAAERAKKRAPKSR